MSVGDCSSCDSRADFDSVRPYVPGRIGFKPPATIAQEQSTVKYDGSEGVLAAKGRHDPCVLPRAVPIVETMAAIVVME